MDVQSLFYLSVDASTVSYLLPAVFLAFQIRRQPVEYNWLMALTLFSFVVQLGSIILFRFKLSPNYPVSVYNILSPIMFSLFFYKLIGWRRLIPFLILANTFTLALIIYYIRNSGFTAPFPYAVTFQSFVVIVLCILFFYKLIKELPTLQLHKNPMFWIISGLFFAYTGRQAIYAVTNYLVEVMTEAMVVVYLIHNIISILANLVIAYGAYLQFKYHRASRTQIAS